VTLTALVAITRLAAVAEAHVEAAVDENNRYLKLTPMGDRVRIAYTIFIGQRPGQVLRRRLDRDRDGQIDEAEAAAYGEDTAGRVRPAVLATLDGRPAPIAWTTVDVGLGTPSVTGGSFSIDLVGWLCTGGAAHQLVLRDTVALDHPGESEIRIEAAPGVTVGARRIGGRAFDGLETKWTGADGPLTTDGLELAWRVDGAAARPADGRCRAETTTSRGKRLGIWLLGAVVLLAGAGALRYLRGQRKVNG
jgi:hypothetical protein